MPVTPKSLRAAGFVTLKLAPYRCYSPTCRKRMAEQLEYARSIHYIKSPLEKCSYCRDSHYWTPLAIIHLLQEKKGGIIVAKSFDARTDTISSSGDRLDFLCEQAYNGYREKAKHPDQPQHYVRDPGTATCFSCLKLYNQNDHPMGKIIVEGF